MSVGVRIASLSLSLGIVVAGISALVVWSRQPDRFPLRTIEVHAKLKQVDEEEVKAAVMPFLSQGFFWLNAEALRDSLRHLPWVQSVDVRRLWPDRLSIFVQEQTAQARWGEKGVLSTEGVIFYPKLTTISDKLPRFDGPEERGKEMLQQYLTSLEILSPVGLTVRSLSLSANGSWQMILDNGLVVILGKTAFNERLTRFVLAYQSKLQAQSKRMNYVDLRYNNGFAVGWKAERADS